MKVAISAEGKDLKSRVSDFFGRCPFFIFADLENGEVKDFEAVENPAKDQMGGAGISAAKFVVEHGAEAVVSMKLGPRAIDVLNQFGVPAYEGQPSVEQSLRKLAEGRLEKMKFL